ncbi:MAG: hypothetical protein RJA26_799 [Actinomycetota bacterium]
MSNLPSRNRNNRIQQFSVPDGEAVASFNNYAAAVDCVDQLIRHDFPAPMVAIVGSDLKSVERVRGKLSYGTLAFRGLITGSWLGLLFSLFIPVSASGSSVGVTTGAAIVIGAGVGMLLNILRFSLSRNRHEFSSTSAVIAATYDVVVPHPMSQQAKDAIAEHLEQCINGQK